MVMAIPISRKRSIAQAQQLEHVIFTGFTHEPAVRLAERLLALLPGDFSRIFYSDNGSTAVEVAIKWPYSSGRTTGHRRRQPDRGGPVSAGLRPAIRSSPFRHSYHGDTFGAMSVSERSVFTDAFPDYLFDVIFIDTPTRDNIGHLRSCYRGSRPSEIACFIYEPLLQAAGGMRMYEAACSISSWRNRPGKTSFVSPMRC